MSDSVLTNDQLTNDQVSDAKLSLVRSFPRIERLQTDPKLHGQLYCVISYNLFDKPLAHGVMGMMKCRGTFGTEAEAETHIANLLRNVDSQSMYFIGLVGTWMPISMCEDSAEQTQEINLDPDQVEAAHNQQLKDQEAKDRKKAEQIVDREKQLREDTDPRKKEDTDSIDYYITMIYGLRANESQLSHFKKGQKKVEKNIAKYKSEINRLNRKNPQYKNTWQNRQREVLQQMGVDENKIGQNQYKTGELEPLPFE